MNIYFKLYFKLIQNDNIYGVGTSKSGRHIVSDVPQTVPTAATIQAGKPGPAARHPTKAEK